MTIFEAATALLQKAQNSENGRAADVIVHDGPLRQSLIALKKGTRLADHNSPPAASLLLIAGNLQVTGEEESDISEGQLKALTHVRHGVLATEDSVFLLTTVTGVPGITSHGTSN